MIDLHCHILPGMDDGPAGTEESVALCRLAAANHIEKMVLTPHMVRLREAEDFLRKRDRKIELLKRELARLQIDVGLFPGAEVLIDDSIFFENGLERLTLNGSRYLLVEFAYEDLNSSTRKRYVAEIRNRGLVPVFAHPERYRCFHKNPEMARLLASEGVLFQVNADSLCKKTGRPEFRLAKKLVNEGIASFLATDAHGLSFRPNDLLDQLLRISKEVRTDRIGDMLNRNPELVLQNEDMDAVSRPEQKAAAIGSNL
jgi:protein-tyrosine phosphatase